jgi:CRISPR-associated endonuclease Cas1
MLPDALGFAGRSHQGATDAVNAALNYGYGILTSHVWGAVMNAGLEPFAGFLHVERSGKPSLVLDLMEEFRQPVVDRPILSWLNKGGQLVLQKGMLDAASKESVASRVLLRLVPRSSTAASNTRYAPLSRCRPDLRQAPCGACGPTDHIRSSGKPWRGRIDIPAC